MVFHCLQLFRRRLCPFRISCQLLQWWVEFPQCRLWLIQRCSCLGCCRLLLRRRRCRFDLRHRLRCGCSMTRPWTWYIGSRSCRVLVCIHWLMCRWSLRNLIGIRRECRRCCRQRVMSFRLNIFHCWVCLGSMLFLLPWLSLHPPLLLELLQHWWWRLLYLSSFHLKSCRRTIPSNLLFRLADKSSRRRILCIWCCRLVRRFGSNRCRDCCCRWSRLLRRDWWCWSQLWWSWWRECLRRYRNRRWPLRNPKWGWWRSKPVLLLPRRCRYWLQERCY